MEKKNMAPADIKKTISLLEKHKKGEITTDKARRMLFLVCGVAKSDCCELDRLPSECSIILYTSSKDCKKCGHYR